MRKAAQRPGLLNMRHLTAPFWLDDDPLATGFPPVERALVHPNGLLAVGCFNPEGGPGTIPYQIIDLALSSP